MNWLVKNAAANADLGQADPGHKVVLPDAVVPGEAFAPGGVRVAGALAAVWNRTHRTLVLTDARGVERNVRVRACALQAFDGEAATQVAVEFVDGSARGVRSFTGTVEPLVPGQANRGRAEAGKALLIRSQITGKILKVLIKVGDRVAAGDTLMIVEAMKMENRIFAAQGGVVAVVAVKEGDSVATGKELVRLANE